MLQTDISRFYHSIYTHAIAWAQETKPIAKADHGLARLGNKIDYWVRMGQDSQTVGIPIGPDTSLVLAELIMQRCDETLLTKIPHLRGHRFIDDYELSFETRIEAENAIDILQLCLSEYELALNPYKTAVLDLPLPLEPPWATELRRFAFRTSRPGQAADLSDYFSRAFVLRSENLDDSVLQFAVARLRTMDIDPTNWGLFQKLLFLCVTPEPACLPFVLEQIIKRRNEGAPPILPQLEEIINSLTETHAVIGHSSEVAHAVWACLACGLRLHDKAVEAISNVDDSVVALLALHCERQGLVSKAIDKTLWSSYMTPEELYGEHWLLAYEANVKGWLPTVGGGDHVGTDANFGFLKANGVSFYDVNLGSPPQAAPIPLPTLPMISVLATSASA